jgi:hypothetical protein
VAQPFRPAVALSSASAVKDIFIAFISCLPFIRINRFLSVYRAGVRRCSSFFSAKPGGHKRTKRVGTSEFFREGAGQAGLGGIL